MSRKTELSLLGLILTVSALLRFVSLDSVPPGWHHDEAIMGLIASEVYRGIQRPIFFPSYLGLEPLYPYLSAGTMWLMGGNQDVLPLRLTSAALGIATVGVTYLLGREMFDRRVGLVAAALMGTSFWQLILSRGGSRPVAQPLLEGLAIYLLWRAARRRSVAGYAFAGLALGATLYTYLGARMFPAVVGLFALWWLAIRGWPRSEVRLPVAAYALASVASVAPLAIFFLTSPDTFTARMNQVGAIRAGATLPEAARALGANLVKLLSATCVYWDTLWRFDIPGRPIFVGAAGVLFAAGLLVALRGVWRREPAHSMVLIWLATMTFPCILTADSGGYAYRAVGLLPALYLLPALGLVWSYEWAVARIPRRWPAIGQPALSALVVVVLLVDGGLTYRDYFHVWAKSFGEAFDNMVDVEAASRLMDREARLDDEQYFMSMDIIPSPAVSHLAPRVYPYLRWFDGRSAVVFSPSVAKESVYMFPFRTRPRQLDKIMPAGACTEQTYVAEGIPMLTVCRLRPEEVEAAVSGLLENGSLVPERQRLGNAVEMLGYRLDRRVEQGGKLYVTVVWRALRDTPSEDYLTFAHLLDHQAKLWALDDSDGYPTKEWKAGDFVVAEYALEVGDRVPPGRYSVSFGAYDRRTMKRLHPSEEEAGHNAVNLGYVKVAGGAGAGAPASTQVSLRLGEAVQLAGFDLTEPSADAMPFTFHVRLHWQALTEMKEDYTVFVQLLNSEGKLVAQSDCQPAQGRFPTSIWSPGETVLDEHELKLDPGVPPGRYTVIAGMYLLSTGQRLPVDGGGDFVRLGDLDVGG